MSGPQSIVDKAKSANVKVCVSTDLLALTMLTPPGEWGADIAVGSAQVTRGRGGGNSLGLGIDGCPVQTSH